MCTSFLVVGVLQVAAYVQLIQSNHTVTMAAVLLRPRDWIVPRRGMCTAFWCGVILIFTSIILLVTSRHKGR